ncbi:MAG: acyltransferase family protein [Terriglobales bacterium]
MTTRVSVPSRNLARPVSDPVASRLMSLDVLRGLAVAGMILVTDPGTYSAVYRPLLHSQWNGVTPTDMIFPAFLFAVGIAITLSFSTRIRRGYSKARMAWHVLVRSVALFLIGLAINGFPDYNLHTIRIPGVLQRISLCYLCGSFLYLGILRVFGDELALSKPQAAIRRIAILGGTIIFFLAGYWFLLESVPVPGFGPGRLDSLGNLGAYLDRSIFGVRHLWAYGTTPGHGVTFDPEGLLSTIPAIATLLIGILTAEWLRTEHSPRRKALTFAGVGLGLAITGYLLHPLLPINKKLWTSTFALFSGGINLISFSFLYWILDINRWRRWAIPALVFGTNAILGFVLSSVITTLTDTIHVTPEGGSAITFHTFVYRYGFAAWLQPVHASLAYAIAIVILNLALIYPLYRRRIFLRL